jgi:hypothetical protein
VNVKTFLPRRNPPSNKTFRFALILRESSPPDLALRILGFSRLRTTDESVLHISIHELPIRCEPVENSLVSFSDPRFGSREPRF